MADKDKDIPVKITLTDKTRKEVGSATVNAPGSHTFTDLTPGTTYSSTLTPPDEFKVVTENPRRYTLKDTFKEKEKSLTIEIFLDKSPILGGVGQKKAGSPDTPIPDSVLITALIGFVCLLLAGNILGVFRDEPSPPPVVTVSPQTNAAQTSSTQTIGTATDSSTALTDRPSSVSIQPPQSATAQLASSTGEVFIVGEDVNVRLEPDLNSPVLAQISNSSVQVDAQAIGTPPGWQAIVLPDGTRGYVSAQFVRFPGQNVP